MLTKTPYTVSKELLQLAISNLPEFDRRINLNAPTGDFFYDKWKVLPEFENTIWERILSTLPFNIGEARLMKLSPEQCYRSHADLDDRFHLSLIESRSYLVDLDNNVLHRLHADGYWYDMDASRRHSAVNFGSVARIQLVIRKLLTNSNLTDPVPVNIVLSSNTHDFRFVFDDVFSPLISKINKDGKMNNFKVISNSHVSFNTEKELKDMFKSICPSEFKII